MHGLVLSAAQKFVTDSYGAQKWSDVATYAGFDDDDLDTMFVYDAGTGEQVMQGLTTALKRPLPEILEDIGTYLVSHQNTERLRRLLRFGGVTFEDFLDSLNDLPDRARLAVPDLILPELDLRPHSVDGFTLIVRGEVAGFGHVLVGLLRSMADDYGALAMVDHEGGGQGVETVNIRLLERTYARGRDFVIGAQLP